MVQPGYVKPMSQGLPVEPEKLKPLLHEKIEHMNGRQLSLLHRILLQVEAEELADRLGEAFERDREQGRLEKIPELIRQFRSEHPYE